MNKDELKLRLTRDRNEMQTRRETRTHKEKILDDMYLRDLRNHVIPAINEISKDLDLGFELVLRQRTIYYQLGEVNQGALGTLIPNTTASEDASPTLQIVGGQNVVVGGGPTISESLFGALYGAIKMQKLSEQVGQMPF
jgi:hypothetical protein